MNKQELIDELIYELENVSSKSINKDFEDGYNGGIRHALELVKEKKLDEPKKVVVPQFVAEWIELYKKENKTTLWHVMNKIINEKFLNHQNIVIWFENDSNKHILEQAWVNGYEVEKEQLYYVKLPEIGYMRFGKKYFYSTDKEDAKRYTENQIKTIDERYWPFAVKVDGEQMKRNWKRVINKFSGIAIMILVAKATVSHFVYGNDITSSDLVYFLSCSFILGLGLYLGGSSV